MSGGDRPGGARIRQRQRMAAHGVVGDGQNAKSSIYLSTDSGMIWNRVLMVLNEDFPPVQAAKDLTGTVVFTEIKWAKSNPNIAFASCVKQSLAHDFVDSIGWGTFKSTDGGMSWTNKQNGITGLKNTWSLDVDPNDENTVYAATNDAGVFKSINGGENWSEINNGFGDVKSFHSVSICPANTMVLLAGSEEGQIFRSENSGESWIPVLSDLRTGDNIVSIVFNPVSSTHQVYAAGNATGFYVSGDDGQSWQQYNNGLLMRELTGLAVTPGGDAVYGSTNGGGIFRLPVSGNSLTLIRNQIEIPSNAGIDGSNNRDQSEQNFNEGETHETIPGGVNVNSEDFSFTLSGKAAHGLKISPKKATKSSAIIILSAKSIESFNGKEILVSTDFPGEVIKVIPSRFTIGSRNKIKVLIQIKSRESLRDLISGKLPDKINFFLNLELEGSEVIKKVTIPLVYTN